jgi:hypothetical protein
VAGTLRPLLAGRDPPSARPTLPGQWPEVQNPIRITHWGYHIKGPARNPWFKREWDCFDVHKDVVAAPHDATFQPPAGYQWPPLKQLLRGKTRLMMYSGWVENKTFVAWQPVRTRLESGPHGALGLRRAMNGQLAMTGVSAVGALIAAPAAATTQPADTNQLPCSRAEWQASCLLLIWDAPGAQQALRQQHRPRCSGDRPPERQVPGCAQIERLLPQPRRCVCAGAACPPPGRRQCRRVG